MTAIILLNSCSRRPFCVLGRFTTQVRHRSTLRCLSGMTNQEYLRANAAVLPILRKVPSSKNVISPFSVRTATTEAEGGLESNEEELRIKREKMARRMQYTLIAMVATFGGLSFYGLLTWGKPRTDEEGNVIQDKFSNLPKVQQYFLRTIDTVKNYNEVLKEPSRELLLPPPLEHPYMQPPYTLVIEMTGVLLNPEWTYKMGWRFKKRPFIDYFLQQCGPPLFELVIFTEETGFTAFPLIDNMDPNGYVMHRLFRDSTRYDKGVRLKDLNCLNRDLKRVIHIDWNKSACKLNSDNCLILKKWEGDSNDKSLFDLAQLIRTIAAQGIDDVREIISHYNKQEDPLQAFREYQMRVAQQEESKAQPTKQPSTLVSSFKRK
ncbi:mitochondrial import inner membrane translocase subunit TIM50-like protein [Leptotrombidium deliense]|uniref:Mitochondrial import inner membrane translocase subunit TIM50 n=1 Tax=Leptotrombidium deliense TaxID=299467 RepID=A0A443S617_9ACAR|nr:mitochondrial import inner membrane translocase subunit TIM50-like protein [Leptotrombidium deliense]